MIFIINLIKDLIFLKSHFENLILKQLLRVIFSLILFAKDIDHITNNDPITNKSKEIPNTKTKAGS